MVRVAVLLALLLPASAGAASFARTDVSLAEAGKPSTPVALELADVDGDADPDVLVNLFQSGAVSDLGVLINDGAGGFAPLRRFPLCQEAADLVVADFDQDGRQDVVVACYGPLALVKGDGAGNFGAVSSFSTGPDDLTNRREVEPIQINPGGAPEVAFVREGGDGNAAICFTAHTEPAGSTPVCGNPTDPQPAPIARYPLRAIAFPDVGGVVRRGQILAPSTVTSTSVSVYTRDYLSNYDDWGVNDYAAGGDKIRIADGADVEADGDLDLVIGHGDSSSGTLSVALNASDIEPPVTIPTILAPEDLGVADVDLDGKRDVILSGGYGRAAVHAGAGDGTFGALQEIPLIGFGNPAYASSTRLAIGDVSCDGKADLLVSDYFAQAVQVLVNTGAGPTGPCVAPPPPEPPPPDPPAVPQPQPPPAAGYIPSGGVGSLRASRAVKPAKPFALGTVANPPTAATTQTLARRGKVLARGKTTVPDAQSRPLTFRLNKAGRKALRKRRRLKLALKVVATAPDGTTGTVNRKVTLRLQSRR